MELTHLVRALTARAQRWPLLAFVVAGSLLFCGKRIVVASGVDAAPETLVVKVPAGASPGEVDRAAGEAVLLALAVRAGYVNRDPAVRRRLIENIRFAFPELSDADALERALGLAMHRTDAIARQRLLWLARQTLAETTGLEPSRAELQRYLEAHPERFSRPAMFSFEQVLVSRERDREVFAERVNAVQHALDAGAPPHRAEPSLLPEAMQAATRSRIAGRFGDELANSIEQSKGSDWFGPVTSSWGAHFVRVTERRPSRIPSLDDVYDKVRHAWKHDSEPARVEDALRRLRATYAIRVEEST